jgi:hypothetical protein
VISLDFSSHACCPSTIRCPVAQADMRRLASFGAVVAAPRGLSINRDQVRRAIAKVFHPVLKANPEQLRIDGREHVAHRLRRHIKASVQFGAQSLELIGVECRPGTFVL